MDTFNTLQSFKHGKLYSLPALGKALEVKIERLPVSIRIVLESVLRNCDGKKVTEAHVRQLAAWKPNAPRTEEIPFVVARIVLQDFTGVPLLCDLAAMRGVAAKMGKEPKVIEPLVPVDLVVDHSVQIDHYGRKDALDLNMKLEFKRNEERYRFMKWGMQAFDTFKVVPPGIGSRVSWMFFPVERSMTVSAPQRMDQIIFSTSSSIEEATAELPIFELIFTRKFRPMIIGSLSGWLIFAGMMARPRATSSRTNSGVTKSGMEAPQSCPSRTSFSFSWARPMFSRMATYSISGVMMPRRA